MDQLAMTSSPAPRSPSLPPRAEAERAFFARDASYDGVFWTGVRTTGIFCRPSCAARKPRPSNVEYFATTRDAMFAGYRPCKRCAPLATDGSPPAWVEALLARVEASDDVRLRAGDLRALGVDPARARRWFLRHHGLTFTAFCRARRLGRALEQMRAGERLDEVALGHGYESHSGFRDAFGKLFGTPPGRSRASAAPIVTTLVHSPLGPLVAAAVDEGVCFLEFADRRMLETQLGTLRRRFARAVVPGDHPHLAQLRRELSAYFAGEARRFTVPTVTPGTPFQEAVWSELLRIPYGNTISYAELARRVGRSGAPRAVGHANGSNRVCILLPCHRVVNKDGQLGGYGGGVWRKRRLLELERGIPVTAAAS